MVDVRFVDPGDQLPEPAKEDTDYFQPSTRKGFLRRLEDLALQRKRRLFVAIDRGRLVTKVVAKVHQVLSINGEEIRLSNSHARHRVSAGVRPLSVGDWFELAIDPASSEILEALPREPQLVLDQPTKSRFPIDISALPPIGQSDAEAFFSSLSRQSHIPFQYPSNGCWARAHEMCRLIEHYFDRDPRVIVAKIWNCGELTVETENNPCCFVPWTYHVAPVVKVGKDLLVIDPALFERPVTVNAWRRRQSDLSREPVFTSMDAYDLAEPGLFVGASPETTESDLQDFWGDFISLLFTHGPIPYPCDSR